MLISMLILRHPLKLLYCPPAGLNFVTKIYINIDFDIDTDNPPPSKAAAAFLDRRPVLISGQIFVTKLNIEYW